MSLVNVPFAEPAGTLSCLPHTRDRWENTSSEPYVRQAAARSALGRMHGDARSVLLIWISAEPALIEVLLR